jgi:hypothetical protein
MESDNEEQRELGVALNGLFAADRSHGRNRSAYEPLHPETRNGQAQANAMNRGQGADLNDNLTTAADFRNKSGPIADLWFVNSVAVAPAFSSA